MPNIKAGMRNQAKLAGRRKAKLYRRQDTLGAKPVASVKAVAMVLRVRLISALSESASQSPSKPQPGTRPMATASSYRQSPRIRRTPGVCGGAPCVGDSRIPVWLLEHARRLGATVRSLVADYPSLRGEDIKHAWAFAERHKVEIDAQIRENEAD